MPLVEQKYCKPPSAETRLWRYVEQWKLEDLLDTSSLYLTRADRAGDALEHQFASYIEADPVAS